MKANTMKTIILTTLTVLLLVGGLLWIANRTDRTNSAPSQTEWNRAYDVAVNSTTDFKVIGYSPTTIFPDGVIRIEVRQQPRVESWDKVYSRISAEVDREYAMDFLETLME